jgi:hypothetical protein
VGDGGGGCEARVEGRHVVDGSQVGEEAHGGRFREGFCILVCRMRGGEWPGERGGAWVISSGGGEEIERWVRRRVVQRIVGG